MNSLTLYRLATRVGGPLFGVALQQRARRAKEDPARLPERLGHPSLPRPAGPLLWLHGASVGEALSVLPLIEALLGARPALQALLTTGTVTSARLMAERLPPRARHQFAPVDRPDAWRRFLEHWRPDLLLLVESELWPNLILESRRQKVPMALINARMSARSAQRWRHLPGAAAGLLAGFELCLAQTALDRDRLRALGAGRVEAIASLKNAASPLPVQPAALAELHEAVGTRPLWLAASTHPSEDALLLEAHRRLMDRLPGLLTIIAPRHPDRGAALAAWLEARGMRVARRALGELPDTDCGLYVADTLGELGLLYRLAPVALVGKSLTAPGGGQNPLEPARLGCPVLFGPHMANFAEPAARLVQAGGARQVGDVGELAATIAAVLADPAARSAMAGRACAAAAPESDVLGATLTALGPLLERHLGPVDAGA
jgi:3-deoxy-D-manno-octulosonic-acid transferase